MLTIYTPHTSPRLQYIVTELFKGTANITNNVESFLQSEYALLNYSDQKLNKGIQIIPVGLLREEGIRSQNIVMQQWEELPVFFSVNSDIPFDLFAASFYLISRYEEYLPFKPDSYGRYDHQNSLAFRNGFLDIPLIDYWMQVFEQKLQEIYPTYRLPKRQFCFQPSYDIDIAFRFRYASPFKHIKGYFTDLLLGRFEALAERSLVYSGKKADSYDIYDWLNTLHRKYGLEPYYFFLAAEKQQGVDRNVDPFTRGMRNLIAAHAQQYRVGVHPSVKSNSAYSILEREVKLLSFYAGHDIRYSRQHYLQFKLPHTYHNLLKAGIRQEHSMGYGAINGFRASTSFPFNWYDFEKEQTTSLQVLPFSYMDSTTIFHERLNTEMATDRMMHFFNATKKVNGVFSFVMHNHFLTTEPDWIMWRNMYESFLDKSLSLL